MSTQTPLRRRNFGWKATCPKCHVVFWFHEEVRYAPTCRFHPAALCVVEEVPPAVAQGAKTLALAEEMASAAYPPADTGFHRAVRHAVTNRLIPYASRLVVAEERAEELALKLAHERALDEETEETADAVRQEKTHADE